MDKEIFFLYSSPTPTVASHCGVVAGIAPRTSIFVGAEREENLIRNDPDKSEFTIDLLLGVAPARFKAFLVTIEQDLLTGRTPLEAILVILSFGRRALNFLFESSWKNMKNDTTFVRMRSGPVVITLETQKCRKRAPRSVEFNFSIRIAIDRNGFRRFKEEGQIYKTMSQIRVSSCWVFIANSFFSSHQQSVLQSTTFRPGCPGHFARYASLDT